MSLNRFCIVVFVVFLFGCTQEVEKRNIDSFQLTEESLFSADYSGDGQWVSVYTVSKTLDVYDISSRTRMLSLPMSMIGEVARAYTLNNAKSQLLVAGEQRVSVWSVADGTLLQYYNVVGAEPLARISSLAMSPDDQTLAIGMSDGSIVLMLFNDKQVRLFKPHEAEVATLVWDKKSQRLLSGGLDGIVSLWDTQTNNTLMEYTVSKRVTSLSVDPTFTLAFVSDSLSDQHVFNVNSGTKLTSLSYPERFRWFRNAYLFETSPYLVTTSSKTQLYIWNKTSGKLLKSFHIDAGDKESLVLGIAPRGSTGIQTISSEGRIEYWDISNLVLE